MMTACSATTTTPNAPPAAHILDSSGQEVTAQVSSGTLGGFLQVRNVVLPSLQGDGQQAGAPINYVTKSGTNQYHGNAEYWWEGRAMNADDWFNKTVATRKEKAEKKGKSSGGIVAEPTK